MKYKLNRRLIAWLGLIGLFSVLSLVRVVSAINDSQIRNHARSVDNTPDIFQPLVSPKSLAVSLTFVAACGGGQKQWDGGGATNNWSEAANWCDDTVPVGTSSVVFDGTSNKNAIIDTNTTIQSLTIDNGFASSGAGTGELSMSSNAALTVNGDWTQNGASFSGGSGDVQLSGQLTINAGTFLGPTGTVTLASALSVAPAATLTANSGTFAFTGSTSTGVTLPSNSTVTLNNITINKTGSNNITFNATSTLKANGTLTLTDGGINQNSNNGAVGTLEGQGDVVIAPTFDGAVGGFGSATLRISGAAARTVTLPAGVSLPVLTVAAPAVTINTSGSGAITFNRNTSITAQSLTNGSVDFVFSTPFAFLADFVQGSGNLTFNDSFTQAGGTFTPGSGSLAPNLDLVINGGTFTAPAGTLNIIRNLTVATGATFLPNNGTIAFSGSSSTGLSFPISSTVNFNNVTINKTGGNNITFNNTSTLRVNGSLSLVDGGINQNGNNSAVGTLEALGDVSIASTFDGAVGGFDSATLLISGSNARTVTLPAGAVMPTLTVNGANVTLNASGAPGVVTFLRNVNIPSALSFTNGSVDFVFNAPFSFNTNFTQGSGNATFGDSFTQNGGAYTPGSGALSLSSHLTINAGTFNAPNATLNLARDFLIGPTATFVPNNSTLSFSGTTNSGLLFPSGSTIAVNNVSFNKTAGAGANFNLTSTLKVQGSLVLTDGSIGQNANNGAIGTVEVQGNVTSDPTFDGGPIRLTFSGANNQTLSTAGANPSGLWTIDKTGGTVTAFTSLILGPSQSFNIKNGTLFLNNNSNLTCGALTLGDSGVPAKVGKLVNDSTTTITLGGPVQLFNNSSVDLQGGGVTCPQSDTILIRSTVSGTRRNWSGQGVFKLVDVDVQDMGGSSATLPAITVFSGTNSGNNNSNWTFNGSCPSIPTIAPQTSSAVINTSIQFTVGGGANPLTFSLAVNNSGGSINSSTGLYTAGPTSGVSDTVRVTDLFGITSDATVTVTGPAHHLAFSSQPQSAAAGQLLGSVEVAIQDQANNVVGSASNQVAMAIGNNPGCPSNCASLSGITTRNAVNGIATFGNLSIQRVGTAYTLQATATGLLPATSSSFNISSGSAAKLAFVTQPTNTVALTLMNPSVQVAVQDAFGNQITTVSGTVSLSLDNNPGNDQKFGSKSATLTGGIATFTDISSNVPANGYTFVAHRNGLTDAISTPFNITRPLLVVTNTNNSGSGSLKQAIDTANLIQGLDTINFNINAPGPFTIQPVVPLPEITGPTIIDGTTQPGFSGTPVIELRGQSPTSDTALLLSGGSSIIKGLVINNWNTGIHLVSSGGNVIQGNYIGLTVTGTAASPNSTGIYVNSNLNLIGGTSATARNVISGNSVSGITLSDAIQTTIKGNFLGSNNAGTTGIPNLEGITIFGNTSNSVIGGTAAADTNLIIYSDRGIRFNSALAVRNSIRRNLFKLKHAYTGIDLEPDHRTHNDPGDADGGSNNRQNFPVITSVTNNNGVTTLQGTLNSAPSTQFTIDIFSQNPAPPSEGSDSTFLTTLSVSTDSSGIASFETTLPLLPISKNIFATATDSQGNTSEISEKATVVPEVVSITGRIVSNTGVPLSNIKVELTDGATAVTTTDSNGNYAFNNLAGGLSYLVKPSLLTYSFSPSQGFSPSTLTNKVIDFTGTRVRGNIIGIVNQISGNQTLPVFGATAILNGPVARSVPVNGVLVVTDLPVGQYSITIEKPGVVFSPSNMLVSVTAADIMVNFLGQNLSPLPGRFIFGADIGASISPRSMNADGTALVPISHQPATGPDGSSRFLNSAALSRDGKFLLGPNVLSSLSIANADGSGHRKLNISENNHPADYAFSPDGSKVALIRTQGDALTVANADGSTGPNGTVVPLPSNLTFKSSPSWMSNTRIVFAANDQNTSTTKIYAVNTDGSGFTQIGNSNFRLLPVVSPDGSKIIYSTPQGQLRRMNTDGTGDVLLVSEIALAYRYAWSPDGTKICYTEQVSSSPLRYQFVSINSSNGGGKRVIINTQAFAPSWGPLYEFTTPSGSNQTVNTGLTSITFSGVTSAGTTTVTQIPANSLPLPGSFRIYETGLSFEISTTASVTPPITVCIKIPQSMAPSQTDFAFLRLMHAENGQMQDVTTSTDFATLTICGSVNSLSPFVIAEIVDPSRPAISGLVQDLDGNPLADIPVQLTGAETRTTVTNAFGNFAFVNLTQSANYNVQPKQAGYLFTEYSQDIVNLNNERTVVFTGNSSTVQISGRVTNPNGGPVSNVTINVSGPSTQSTTTDDNGNYTLAGLLVDGTYTVSPQLDAGTVTPANIAIDPLIENATGIDFVATASATPTPTPLTTIQFTNPNVTINENSQSVSVTLTRTGDTSGTSTVNIETSDLAGTQTCNQTNGAASSRCDYQNSSAIVQFNPGETSKSFKLLLVDDVYLEGPETFFLNLSNPANAALGAGSTATVSINDNEIANGVNPNDLSDFFVRQHYLDFFTREPDGAGLAFWTNEITSCGSSPACLEVKRINVSAAFYLSIEFQETGYLIERIYKAAFGDSTGVSTLGGAHTISVPIIRLDEFLTDTQQIGSGVIVNQAGWEQVLENNKVAFVNEFVGRSRFTTALPNAMTPTQFVDQLNTNAGGVLSAQERDQLINDLTLGTKTRGQVLRAVADDVDLNRSEFNRAFVLMQYFGYLRRNPNDAPDADYTGYEFWLTKLNQFNGNFIQAEMVKAFIQSLEYRERFGPVQ